MVVWCCATANTKPRLQPSDDAEYCLYVKFSASAGFAAKTSTAHNSRESFAITLPPCLFSLGSQVKRYHSWGFQSLKRCAHSPIYSLWIKAALALVSALFCCRRDGGVTCHSLNRTLTN